MKWPNYLPLYDMINYVLNVGYFCLLKLSKYSPAVTHGADDIFYH